MIQYRYYMNNLIRYKVGQNVKMEVNMFCGKCDQMFVNDTNDKSIDIKR